MNQFRDQAPIITETSLLVRKENPLTSFYYLAEIDMSGNNTITIQHIWDISY